MAKHSSLFCRSVSDDEEEQFAILSTALAPAQLLSREVSLLALQHLGATTLSIMTLGIRAFSVTALSIRVCL